MISVLTIEKPYRPNVGVALFNVSGEVLIGRRFKDDGPEIVLPGLEWQMPQGGIDANENPREAVMRELWEETGVASADVQILRSATSMPIRVSRACRSRAV